MRSTTDVGEKRPGVQSELQFIPKVQDTRVLHYINLVKKCIFSNFSLSRGPLLCWNMFGPLNSSKLIS